MSVVLPSIRSLLAIDSDRDASPVSASRFIDADVHGPFEENQPIYALLSILSIAKSLPVSLLRDTVDYLQEKIDTAARQTSPPPTMPAPPSDPPSSQPHPPLSMPQPTKAIPPSPADRAVSEPPVPRERRATVAQAARPASPAVVSTLPSKPTRKRKLSHSQAPSTVALSDTFGIQDVDRARTAFRADLDQLRIEITRSNRQIITRFSPDECASLTTFFFDRVLGQDALARIKRLISAYNQSKDTGIDDLVGARARIAARNQELPAEIQRLYTLISTAHREHLQNPVLEGILQNVADLELFIQWRHIQELTLQNDPEIVRFLASHNLATSRGVGRLTLLKRFITESLSLSSPNALQNMCQQADGLDQLVRLFGQGILVILPPRAGKILSMYGTQRMAMVYPLLKQYVLCLPQICQLANDTILQPFLAGQVIDLSSIDARADVTLLSMFERRLRLTQQGHDPDAEDSPEPPARRARWALRSRQLASSSGSPCELDSEPGRRGRDNDDDDENDDNENDDDENAHDDDHDHDAMVLDRGGSIESTSRAASLVTITSTQDG